MIDALTYAGECLDRDGEPAKFAVGDRVRVIGSTVDGRVLTIMDGRGPHREYRLDTDVWGVCFWPEGSLRKSTGC